MIKNFLYWVGNGVRETGLALDRVGCFMQGNFAYKEELCRHRRLMTFFYQKPKIADGAWIAPNATVIGKVDVGEKSSVWYGAVLRGDINSIRIGSMSNIGDRCIIHVSSGNPKGALPTIIGNKVTVEHGSILHACTLQDECKVEAGSTILDGAVVGKNSIVGSSSLVPVGKQIPSGELWSGIPAKFVRKLTQEEIEAIPKTAIHLQSIASKHDIASSKPENEKDYEKDIATYFVDVTNGPTLGKSN